MEIEVIKNTNPEINTTVELITPVVGICPHSHEPQIGSFVSVEYEADENLIELHSVEKVVLELSQGKEPLDLETLAQIIYKLCSAKFARVSVSAEYILKSGVVIKCRIQN